MSWDYKESEYDKQAKADPIWGLERLINYGLDGKKINKELLRKYLPQLKIPDNRACICSALSPSVPMGFSKRTLVLPDPSVHEIVNPVLFRFVSTVS